jgi:glycosyltransferase involved in cell wall biosynthesis
MSSDNAPVLSLILCTVGRVSELEDFFVSISNGGVATELIVVDQNNDPSLVARLVDSVSSRFVKVTALHVPKISLAFARNQALAVAQGRYVAFPDDDCTYPLGLIAAVEARLADPMFSQKWKGMCFRFPGARPHIGRSIGRFDLMGKVISFSFVAQRLDDEGHVLFFDERLGVGNFFGAGEESEYLFRGLGRGRLLYIKDVLVFHPEKTLTSFERERSYGRGFGALARVFICDGSFQGMILSLKILLGPIFKIAWSAATVKWSAIPYIWTSARARVEGFVKFETKKEGSCAG